MTFNPNMANRETANLVFLDYKTQVPFLNLDFANVTTTDLGASRVFAKGGQGAPNRIGFDGERNGTIKIDSQITPMKLYSIISGSPITSVAKYIMREVLTSATKALTLTKTPVANSVHVYADGDDCGTPVTVTVADKVATLGGTATDGVFIVYYFVSVTSGAKTVKFNSKTFPKAFSIFGETPFKTEDDEIVGVKLAYYKAQPQSTMSLALSSTGDPTTLSVTCDLLANGDGDIYDMSVIEDEAV
jgi:hypothetical protein